MTRPTDPAPTRRWPTISALGIAQIFAWGSTYYLPAVLAAPVAADTGWPLPWVVGGLSLGLFTAGLAAPRIGRVIAQRGGRPVLAAATLLIAAGLVLLAAAPVLALHLAAWVILGLGMGAGLYDAAFATLGGLYGRQARSAITALTLWGGFASTVCWPLTAALVEALGWRGACLALAAIQAGLCLPLVLALIPPAPAPPADAAAPATALTAAERRAFRLIAAIFVLAAVYATIMSVHLLTILQARGLTLAEAVALGAMFGPAQVAARLVEMAGRGRHHPVWTMLAATGLLAAGLGLLALQAAPALVAILTYGAGGGILSIARGALPLAIFGPQRYAALMGRLARPNLIAQAAAPTLGAMVLVQVGPDLTVGLLALVAVGSVGCSLALLRHRRDSAP